MGYRSVYRTVTVDVDIDMDDFDDDDIKEEYEARFGNQIAATGWDTIYNKRRSLSQEDFFKWFDIIIQDHSGRIL